MTHMHHDLLCRTRCQSGGWYNRLIWDELKIKFTHKLRHDEQALNLCKTGTDTKVGALAKRYIGPLSEVFFILR